MLTFLKTGNRTVKFMFAALAAVFLTSTHAQAYHDGETLKIEKGDFRIIGSYTKAACSAQATLKSNAGAKVGFSIYWRPGKDLYLLVTHPKNASVSGRHKINFVFPDGKKVLFPMVKHGTQLQVPVGIGPRGASFYNALQSNRAVRLDMPMISDSVDVDLRLRAQVQQALEACEQWLH